ncbi:cysteine proteinase inhibitor B [Cucurbita pepo subsp. pepo]|uniref:cysteine proteinase inhibitor B n=1 Tax=Cucurbita pepo subsp. pepo TaxID=3664 RepID=UPI000C9DA43F|nr:cysteine proteinase inhibitor B [Cucurbita pepo subsp. pepo]
MTKARLSLIAVVVLALLEVAVLAEGYSGRIGGRRRIKDVRSNEEVQGLGRFSVEEYNRRSRRSGSGEVKFLAVLAAERQVVAGTKYYLRILGSENGRKRIFESVVVVKPWLRSKQLIDFSASRLFPSRISNF